MTNEINKDKFPILIVDDEYEIIEALKKYLLDFTVDFATSADTALQKIKDGSYKIVLTDIVMPGRDGIELLREIKSINPGIQVIMMTGQTTLMRTSESLQAGATTYLLKPFDDITLVDRAIEKAINNILEWKKAIQLSAQVQKNKS